MNASEADRALVERCVAGDRRAWDELVSNYSSLVYACILRAARGRTAHLSEDEVAELHTGVFLALYEDDCRRLRAFAGRCKLSSWVRVVAVNWTIDFLRRRQRKRQTFVPLPEGPDDRPLDPPDPGPDLDRRVGARREVEALWAAFDTLSEPERVLLQRLFAEETSYEEIATELGVSVGAVYTRKTRLLQRLRAMVTPED